MSYTAAQAAWRPADCVGVKSDPSGSQRELFIDLALLLLTVVLVAALLSGVL